MKKFSLQKMLFVMVLGASAMASAQNTIKTVDATLAGQLGVTIDATNQILNQIKSGPNAASPISNADFIAAAAKFNQEAEVALKNFERFMQADLLPRVKFYLDRLDGIKKAGYKKEDEDALIQDTRNNIQAHFVDFSRVYRTELYKLITLGLLTSPEDSVVVTGQHYKTVKVNLVRQKIKDYVLFEDINWTNASHMFGSGQVFEKMPYVALGGAMSEAWGDVYRKRAMGLRHLVFQEAIKKNCVSSTCVVLLSGHIMFYMKTVMNNLNVTLNFENLEICAFKNCRYDFEGVDSTLANFLTGVLKLVQVQNGDTHGMPFDFTEAEKLKKDKSLSSAKDSVDGGVSQPPTKKNWWEPN